MSEHAAESDFGLRPIGTELRAAVRKSSGHWWVLLVAGILWVAAALVILQFDSASVTTVGIIAGVLFALLATQNFVLSRLPVDSRWVPLLFGVLFLCAAVVCFARPASTFAGMADILGFLFLLIAIWWMIRAFLERAFNPTWWLGLIGGIVMTGVAFWTAGQFFVERAYILLVFAGIAALTEGIIDIARAFEVRRLHETVEPAERDRDQDQDQDQTR
jgi:uncharacterized membrane protein HdeD (DUF308 family)